MFLSPRYLVKLPLLAFFTVLRISLHAQETLVYPTPPANPLQLFYLQRPPNLNTVIYELNIKNGIMDTVEPVHIYWIRYGDKGQKAELSGIQRKYAYGLITKKVGPEHYEIHFNSKKKAFFELKKGADNQFHAFNMINKKPAILSKIFLQINGGPVFSPNIEYVELTGTDVENGTAVTERKAMTKDQE